MHRCWRPTEKCGAEHPAYFWRFMEISKRITAVELMHVYVHRGCTSVVIANAAVVTHTAETPARRSQPYHLRKLTAAYLTGILEYYVSVRSLMTSTEIRERAPPSTRRRTGSSRYGHCTSSCE